MLMLRETPTSSLNSNSTPGSLSHQSNPGSTSFAAPPCHRTADSGQALSASATNVQADRKSRYCNQCHSWITSTNWARHDRRHQGTSTRPCALCHRNISRANFKRHQVQCASRHHAPGSNILPPSSAVTLVTTGPSPLTSSSTAPSSTPPGPLTQSSNSSSSVALMSAATAVTVPNSASSSPITGLNVALGLRLRPLSSTGGIPGDPLYRILAASSQDVSDFLSISDGPLASLANAFNTAISRAANGVGIQDLRVGRNPVFWPFTDQHPPSVFSNEECLPANRIEITDVLNDVIAAVGSSSTARVFSSDRPNQPLPGAPVMSALHNLYQPNAGPVHHARNLRSPNSQIAIPSRYLNRVSTIGGTGPGADAIYARFGLPVVADILPIYSFADLTISMSTKQKLCLAIYKNTHPNPVFLRFY